MAEQNVIGGNHYANGQIPAPGSIRSEYNDVDTTYEITPASTYVGYVGNTNQLTDFTFFYWLTAMDSAGNSFMAITQSPTSTAYNVTYSGSSSVWSISTVPGGGINVLNTTNKFNFVGR